MTRIGIPFLASILLFVAGACTTVHSSVESADSNEESKAIQRMEEYLDNGMSKLDQGAVSEGITQLVSVLAEASAVRATEPVQALRHRAETELSKIRAGIALEAGLEWLDEKKNQISASSVLVGGNNALQPSVILTLNYGGTGKALVTVEPIVFEFTRGGGFRNAVAAMAEKLEQDLCEIDQVLEAVGG